MLSACCNLTTFTPFIPISLNSFVTLTDEIAKSLWLTDYYITPGAGTLETDTGEPKMLHWEYDDERGHMYVKMPDDQ